MVSNDNIGVKEENGGLLTASRADGGYLGAKPHILGQQMAIHSIVPSLQ